MKTTYGFGTSAPAKPITVEEVKRTKLTFGKHKGQSLLDIPTEYLEWLQSEKVTGGENTSTYFMRCLDFAIRNHKK